MPRIFPSLLAAILVTGVYYGSTVRSLAQQSGTNNEKSSETQPRGRKPQLRRPLRKKPVLRRKNNNIKQSAARQRQARPDNNAVLKEQKLSPEMINFLADWEKETAGHQRLTAEIEKYVYDRIFFTEKRGAAEVRFESPDKASLKLIPTKIKKGDKSSRIDPDGISYKLSGIDPNRWVCTGKEIFQIDDKIKNFHAVPIPPNMQGERINEGPIPFLFGLKAEEAKNRFWFAKLNPPKGRNYPNSFWFKAIPRRQIDRQEYRVAKIILDTKRFVPIAIMLVDPTGNTETVYRFKNVKVNPKQRFWDRGPFIKPNLKGYKWVGGKANGNAPPPAGKQPPAQLQPGRVRIGGGGKPVRDPRRK